MATWVQPTERSQSLSAVSSRVTVENVRTVLQALSPEPPTSRQAVRLASPTSIPHPDSMIASISDVLPGVVATPPSTQILLCVLPLFGVPQPAVPLGGAGQS